MNISIFLLFYAKKRIASLENHIAITCSKGTKIEACEVVGCILSKKHLA